jgi:thioredoxin-like negative regulator of GroEL
LREIFKTGKPVLLYFWTSDCAQCKPQERQIEKAITGLRQSGKILRVQKYNAFEELKLAKEMQVMTVPTTVLLDSQGKIAAWNPGLTTSRKIVEQYQTIA